ncbi:Pro-resilin [Folsomia candida]|uniref:Pro-resilin n=1 Tax=Folsomia candida TaxID=158441 RepID=A0A226DK65_FOLCA|nr:Pro-resilin [Folsomia candida]
MEFGKICFILVIGSLFGLISDVDCAAYEKSPRSTRSATKDNSDGYGAAANYNFQYAVTDGGNGNDFGHEEERNGLTTKGSYRVLLPDGRMQVVTYTADEGGYRAHVTYENVGGSGGSGSGGYSSPNPAPSAPYGPPVKSSDTATSASSSATSKAYGALPTTTTSSTSNSASQRSSFGQRNSGSFVKLRRNIKGQPHNYNYTF